MHNGLWGNSPTSHYDFRRVSMIAEANMPGNITRDGSLSKDKVGVKNICNIKQGFSSVGGRTYFVDQGQGLIVSREEFDIKFKNQKTPDGMQIWKEIPISEVVQPDVHKLKTIGESQSVDDSGFVDTVFVDGLKAMVGSADVDDFVKYINTCSSKATLQTCLTEVKGFKLSDNDKSTVVKATVGRIAGI
jgi:hypothetical protein